MTKQPDGCARCSADSTTATSGRKVRFFDVLEHGDHSETDSFETQICISPCGVMATRTVVTFQMGYNGRTSPLCISTHVERDRISDILYEIFVVIGRKSTNFGRIFAVRDSFLEVGA